MLIFHNYIGFIPGTEDSYKIQKLIDIIHQLTDKKQNKQTKTN